MINNIKSILNNLKLFVGTKYLLKSVLIFIFIAGLYYFFTKYTGATPAIPVTQMPSILNPTHIAYIQQLEAFQAATYVEGKFSVLEGIEYIHNNQPRLNRVEDTHSLQGENTSYHLFIEEYKSFILGLNPEKQGIAINYLQTIITYQHSMLLDTTPSPHDIEVIFESLTTKPLTTQTSTIKIIMLPVIIVLFITLNVCSI
uniref:ORF19 n=1 Tax=Physarum polycephalum TaxID=5791 RepID=Q9MJ63_PHYPO|nr:hypothetical protein PhpooMp20 [Physarum polycephalum]BAB08099.1 unnamed protein product [Physarum polycephalum]